MNQEVNERDELIRQSIINLLENKDFKLVIIDEYLNNSLRELVLGDNLNEPAVIDELKARQSLNNFLSKFF
jgi:hypothetical protein